MKAFDTDALALLPDKTLTPEDEERDRKKARLAELEAQHGCRIRLYN